MGELIEVRDPQGRRLRFIYAKSPSGLSRLSAVDTPLTRIRYAHDAQHRLIEVSHPKSGRCRCATT